MVILVPLDALRRDPDQSRLVAYLLSAEPVYPYTPDSIEAATAHVSKAELKVIDQGSIGDGDSVLAIVADVSFSDPLAVGPLTAWGVVVVQEIEPAGYVLPGAFAWPLSFDPSTQILSMRLTLFASLSS